MHLRMGLRKGIDLKLLIGFFMAWGNFFALPCPYKRWDSSLKNVMLVVLPIIGLLIGSLWLGIAALGYKFIPYPLVTAFIMTYYIFAICGYMHLDGFMDCNDAILSRRPLEDRQKILKDSHVGAFAAVSLVMLVVGWICITSTAIFRLESVHLIAIPFFSRAVAAFSVLTYVPMATSQYFSDKDENSRRVCQVAVIIEMLTGICVCIFFASDHMVEGVRIGIQVASGYIACLYGRRQLGGMSGDVSGYTICISEFVGMCMMLI